MASFANPFIFRIRETNSLSYNLAVYENFTALHDLRCLVCGFDTAHSRDRWLRPVWFHRLLLGCCLLFSAAVAAAPGVASHSVYVISLGLHSGVLIPNPGLIAGKPDWPDVFPEADWLEIGWGDGKFYPNPDAGFLLGSRALMVPTDSVLHVVAVSETGLLEYPAQRMLEIALTPVQLENLTRSISDQFKRNGGGAAVPLGPGRYGDSHFFAARGSFHLFHNCNHWVIERLEAAGLDLNGSSAMTGDGLLSLLRRRLAETTRGSNDGDDGPD